MKMKKLFLMTSFFVLQLMASSVCAISTVYDDFEDGVIDANLWVVGGGKGGVGGFRID
jgi:D-arabinose 1-dehydrogenase-like Zn-dependent alcohol dehydrogenase